MPYTRIEEAEFPNMMATISREELAFVVHVGDIKAANDRCSDELFLQRRAWFDASRHPFVFVPGDNEWVDCARFRAGSYGPLERLDKLRELFHAGGESLGQRRIALERQSRDYPEHQRWRHGGVLFATLNVPGGSNNARDMPEEFRKRSAEVQRWLAGSFAAAREAKLPAIVLFMHADPWVSPSSRYFGYRELLASLTRETQSFAGQVLLVHGDTHRHRFDAPLRDPASGAPVGNFTRIEVYGSPGMNWVRVRVVEENGGVRFVATPGY